MMEQTKMCTSHNNLIFITSFNHMVISDASTCLSHIFHSTFMSAFNIIPKWEECI